MTSVNGAMRVASAPAPFSVRSVVYRPNLRYEVERVSNEGEKRLSLAPLLRGTEGSGVIYAATAKEVRAVADYLGRLGFDVAPYHEQLSKSELAESLDRFLSGALKAIIIACGPGAGIDKPDIRFAIHYSMPASIEDYYQESGRAGRDGRPARCVLLFQGDVRRPPARLFAASGQTPKPEEAIAVYAALEALRADLTPASLERIQTSASGAPKVKTRAILSMLKNMGFVKERRGARYTLLKRGLSEQEMWRLAARYASKGESDREKLERMALYAQSPECRWKLMLEYLGATTERTEQAILKECGHCDNCSPATRQSRPPESATRPDFIDLLFANRRQEESQIRPGDMVKLPTHGEVKVKAIEGDKIVVSLPNGETRKFKQEWVIR